MDMKYQFNFRTLLSAATVALLALTLSYNAQADEAQINKVRAELVKMIPSAIDAEIVESPVNGVYRLEVQGNYAYAYVQGDFVLIGDLYNTKDSVNLGELASAKRMAMLIEEVPSSKMIVYGSDQPKRTITVFTDIDCGYCRKLHADVPKLTEAGVQVRYLAFPRAGIGSNSHKKYVSVWCNDNQQTALTDAKAGKDVAAASCDNPIADNYNLGRKVGVRGTPTIVFDDGTVTPGYLPYTALIARLGLEG